MLKAIDIIWETDGEEIDLPTEIDLPNHLRVEDMDAITDYLSDETGFLVITFNILTEKGEII